MNTALKIGILVLAAIGAGTVLAPVAGSVYNLGALILIPLGLVSLAAVLYTAGTFVLILRQGRKGDRGENL